MACGIRKKDIREFEKYAGKLNDLIIHIREYCPEAQYYLANESLHLMNGPSHSCPELKIRAGESISDVLMKYMSGGDW